MTDIINSLEAYNNGRENASQLDRQLEETVKTTLSNHQYRIELGANPKYWFYFNIIFDTLLQDNNEVCLISLIKLTRNVVAGELHNQKLAIEYGALHKIEETLQLKTSSETDNTMILQVGTQAICNILTNNPAAIELIWKVWMSNEDRGLIWSYILSKSNEGLIMSSLVLIINCIRGNKANCDLLISSKLGQGIIAAILGDIERLHGNESSKNFELGIFPWLLKSSIFRYTIFSELFTFGYFKHLYTNIDDFSDKISISDHQTILLKLLDSKIHANNKNKISTFPEFMCDHLEFPIQLFQTVAQETIKVILSVKISQQETSLQVEAVTNIYTAIVLLLQMMNELFVLDEHHTRGIKQMLIDVDALSLVTDILGHLEQIKLPPAEQDNPLAGFNFLKRECIRLIGTLCYRDKIMQDQVRELGGIPLILCQFKIDDSNPYLREYATLTLRNVMENNQENQALITELRPEEVLQTEELTQMGITPLLTPDGKVRIKREI